MAQRILNFSISLIALLLLSTNVYAQRPSQATPRPTQKQSQKEEKSEPEIIYPLWNGLFVGVDILGPGAKMLGSDFMSSEITACLDLKHRYFPTVEVGYGNTDTWNDFGIHYKTNAPYFRIGMDYNTLYKKAHGHMLLVGARLGASSFKYDVMTPALNDPIYGGSFGNPNLEDVVWDEAHPAYNHPGMKGSMMWLELSIGIRTKVYKRFYMGWSVRYRSKLSASTDTYGNPWYVPGFGKFGSSTLGITYTISYQLPVTFKR